MSFRSFRYLFRPFLGKTATKIYLLSRNVRDVLKKVRNFNNV